MNHCKGKSFHTARVCVEQQLKIKKYTVNVAQYMHNTVQELKPNYTTICRSNAGFSACGQHTF